MANGPTIIDVAQHAGVSKSTVSLVLQKSPLVRSETRQAVENSINALNYVYNRSAANLRSARAGLVGIVINDLRNPFFSEFSTSVQMTFFNRGYATVIANTDEDPEIQRQVVASMIEHRVSCFVISPTYDDHDATFDQIERVGIPAMQVLRKVDERTAIFPFSSPDYLTGGRLAARHLIELGATRIAFVGGYEGRQITAERMEGFLEVTAAAGLEPRCFFGRATRAFGWDTACAIARDCPEIEAVFCFNDLVALGMISAFTQLGMHVGSDIRLVGFDGIEECSHSFPQLSTVNCDIASLGRELAATMLNWLDTGTRPEPVNRAPVQLIERRSSRGI